MIKRITLDKFHIMSNLLIEYAKVFSWFKANEMKTIQDKCHFLLCINMNSGNKWPNGTLEKSKSEEHLDIRMMMINCHCDVVDRLRGWIAKIWTTELYYEMALRFVFGNFQLSFLVEMLKDETIEKNEAAMT